MRSRVVIGAVLVSLVAVGAAVAALEPRGHEATVTLSSAAAGANSVAVTVQLPAALQCGRPMGGPVSVTLPRGERMPHSIATATVRVNGVAPGSVSLVGRTVTVSPPVHRGVTCMSIVEGRMKIVLAQTAGLGNPSAPGSYTVVVRQGNTGWLVPVTIKAA
jgi:hypothetical protein